MRRRFAATLAYNGVPFAGYQRQNTAPNTVQAAVEAVLSRFVKGEHVPVIGAGRTDAGVHATGQVIAFDLPWQRTPEELQRAINAQLPQAIAIRGLRVAAPGFNPRFDAVSRRYVYQVYNTPVRQPAYMWQAWHIPQSLDFNAMRQAARHFVGTYDFRSFGRAPSGGDNTTRTIMMAHWEVIGPRHYTFTVVGNAFLYRMVRRMVGVCVDIGRKRMTEAELITLLHEPDGGVSLTLAAPYGLTLVSVDYDETASDRTQEKQHEDI